MSASSAIGWQRRHCRRRRRAGRCARIALAALMSCIGVGVGGRGAEAQSQPKFEFAKNDGAAAPSGGAEPPPIEWKAQAKGGALLSTGNSQSRGVTFGVTVSRKEGNNRVALEGGLAYGRSNVLTPVIPDPAMPTIVAVDRTTVDTTNNWVGKGRYDRFFTANNSGYVSGQVAADKIAGKAFFGGGQAGYSRQLLKDDHHLLVAEIGYDLSFERYVQQPMRVLAPITIHSARVFVGETLKLSPETGITGNVEALFNLNREGKAIDVDTRQAGVAAFQDTRVVGKVGLTTTLRKKLSIGLGFTVRYDQNPAPLPVPKGAPAGAMYGAGAEPFAEKVDTLAEATLIYTFL
jgi:hypothetical protein